MRASGERTLKATYKASAFGICNLPCATDATFYCLRWQVLVGPTESLLLLRIARSKYLILVSELFPLELLPRTLGSFACVSIPGTIVHAMFASPSQPI